METIINYKIRVLSPITRVKSSQHIKYVKVLLIDEKNKTNQIKTIVFSTNKNDIFDLIEEKTKNWKSFPQTIKRIRLPKMERKTKYFYTGFIT